MHELEYKNKVKDTLIEVSSEESEAIKFFGLLKQMLNHLLYIE